MPPYDILRKLYATFGIDELNRARFAKMIEKAKSGGADAAPRSDEERGDRSDARRDR